MTLTQRDHISQLTSNGDYCFVSAPEGEHVVLACPFCDGLMACNHAIVIRNPLSLSPSVVGPASTTTMLGAREHCGHHFFIRNGVVELAGPPVICEATAAAE